MIKMKLDKTLKWVAIGILLFYIISPLDLLPLVEIDDGIAGMVAAYLFLEK